MKRLFTSESVTEGHPDKVCDKVSDSVLDAALAIDPKARVACECATTTDYMLVMGEVSCGGKIDYEKIARDAIKEIGYVDPSIGFDYKTAKIDVRIDKQSADIAQGVNSALDSAENLGAGDQGMMFGYACDDTIDCMPLAISLSHALARRLSEVRKSGQIGYLRPDGKTQVAIEYEGATPKRADTVLVSTQHGAEVDLETIKKDLYAKVIEPVAGKWLDKDTKILVNPTGKFVVGGPHGDSGLTGRKIIVDTYGGYCPHGGGAFSGKDSTKVDRSAAYMARYVCKNIVAAGLAKRVQLQISYAIGVAAPMAIFVDTFGTGVMEDIKLTKAVKNLFDMRPQAIIKQLDLQKPVFARTAAYGHFGGDVYAWEKLDRVAELKKLL
ncbi:MAG: methionine adenosyltransferase [Firmicutes bacterium]|nr:methionine adenosyltransferase [Bacillota bacterium]